MDAAADKHLPNGSEEGHNDEALHIDSGALVTPAEESSQEEAEAEAVAAAVSRAMEVNEARAEAEHIAGQLAETPYEPPNNEAQEPAPEHESAGSIVDVAPDAQQANAAETTAAVSLPPEAVATPATPPPEATEEEEEEEKEETGMSSPCAVLMEAAPRISAKSTSRHRSTSRQPADSQSPRRPRSPALGSEGANSRSVLSEARPKLSPEAGTRGRSSSLQRPQTSSSLEAEEEAGLVDVAQGPADNSDVPTRREDSLRMEHSTSGGALGRTAPRQVKPRSLSRPRTLSGRSRGASGTTSEPAAYLSSERTAPARTRGPDVPLPVEGTPSQEPFKVARDWSKEGSEKPTVPVTKQPEGKVPEMPGLAAPSPHRAGHPAPLSLNVAGLPPFPSASPVEDRQESSDSAAVRRPLLQTPDSVAGDVEMTRGRKGEALRWDCGLQRQLLRQEFNSHEVSAALLVRRFDHNRSGVLEAEELRSLLQDYNGGRPVRDDDLRFILTIADTNRDDCISKEELLFALKVWYALNWMPKSVGAAMTRYKIGGGPPPSVATLRECLTTLNDSLPVPISEVQLVLAAAMRLGGTERLVTTEQMRKGIASWYLHVQRDESSNLQLAGDAHVATVRQLADAVSFVKELVHSPPEYDPVDTTDSIMTLDVYGGSGRPGRKRALAGLVLGVASFLLALLELWVGRRTTSEQCPKRLAGMLHFSGVALLLATFANVGVFLTSACGRGNGGLLEDFTKNIPCPLIATLVVVVNLVHLVAVITGSSWVVVSSPTTCGMFLWETCNFVYIILPLLFALSICCGPCCCYCCLGAWHGMDRFNMDRHLMEP